MFLTLEAERSGVETESVMTCTPSDSMVHTSGQVEERPL